MPTSRVCQDRAREPARLDNEEYERESEREDSRPESAHRCDRPRLRRSAAGRRIREERLRRHRVRRGRIEDHRDQRRPQLHPGRQDGGREGKRRCRPPARDQRHVEAEGDGCHRHLRADAAAKDQGPRSLLRRSGGGFGEGPSQARAAGDPRVDHLSGDDRRSRPAGARGRRAEGGRGFPSRVLPRAGRPGQRVVQHARRSPRSSAASTRRARSWLPISTDRSSTTSCR